MIKLKKLLKESTWANRKFGEKLPTMKDYQEAYDKKLTEGDDKSLAWLLHLEYDSFNKIEEWVKEIKKHSVASKDPKIKRLVKLLFKIEADLGEAINNLDVPQSNRGYDKKRFKRRTGR